MSAEQSGEFMLAYRRTFEVDDHGTALRTMYANFAERFGVGVDILREIVHEDLKENPELYAKLRSDLASRRAADAPLDPMKNSGNVRDPVPSSRTHPCRICGQDVPVNSKGALRLHNAEGRSGPVPCPAAGLIVATGKRNRRKRGKGNDPVNRALPASRSAATTGRLNDTAKSDPRGVRKVIGGGSPGLGKNAK